MIFKVAGLVSSIAILAAISTSAMAQTTNSNSNANSSSGAVSGSSSGAAAISRGGNATGGNATANQGVTANTNTGVTLNQTSNSSPNTSNTERFTGGTSNSNYNQQGGYTSSDNIVRAAPTVYAPPVSGGSPCSLGYSAGASFLGWGAAAGGQVVDSECERRMHVAMLYNAGWKGASKELACNNKEVYFAFRGAGEPCNIRPQWEQGAPAPQPMVQQQQQPTVVTPVMAPRPAPMAAKTYPKCNPRLGITDNCTS